MGGVSGSGNGLTARTGHLAQDFFCRHAEFAVLFFNSSCSRLTARPPDYPDLSHRSVDMEKLNEFLKLLVSSSGYELRLEPNKNPFIVSVSGSTDVADEPLLGPQISTMVFPLIPYDARTELPNSPEIQFVHPHVLGKFTFTVTKSPAGFVVAVRPVGVDPSPIKAEVTS